jgi:hypothetical protein
MARPEDPDVLADELEETEKELFDTRELFFEEVRLNKQMADEISVLSSDVHTQNENLWHCISTHHKVKRRLLDKLEAERAKAKSRDRWIGVALGAAFLLGGYFGVLFGLAS